MGCVFCIHHHNIIIHYIFVFIIDMEPDITDKKSDKQLIVKMAGYLEKKGRMVGIVDDVL